MKRIVTLLSFTLISTFIFAQPLVSTWVGTGTPGYITGQNSRTITPLDMPYGVAMDSKGNLWLSEEGGNGFGFVIKMVQPSGTTSTRAGSVGEDCFHNAAGIASKFSQPHGLAVDANDNIYVADYGNCVIRKIDKFVTLGNAQTVSTYAGKNDSVNQCYTTYPGFVNGNLKTAQFNGPADIAIDKTTGAMYIADAMNNCIRKILNGQVTTLAGLGPDSAGYRDGLAAKAKFNFPTGVFEASNGDVYVADHNNQRIRKISGGTVSTVVPFNADLVPDDVWVTTNGDIYMTTKQRMCKYSGTTFTTYAGSSAINDFGDADGLGTVAKLYNVKCMIADNSNSGIFYVADQNNHKIKKVVNCASFVPGIIRYGGQNIGDTSYTCTGDTIYLKTDSTFTSYKWSTGETTQNIFKTATTKNITCTVTNNDGCQGISNDYHVRISPLNPVITADGPETFCPGDSVYILGPSNYDWYKWTRNGTLYKQGANAQGLYVSQKNTGIYVLTGTVGACVGSSTPDTLATSSTIIPDFLILQGSAALCDNDTLKLISNGNFTSYQWKKGGVNYATTKSVNITTAGTYTLSVTSTGGCSGTSLPITVTIKPAPPKPTITITTQTTMTSSSATNNQWYYNGQPIPNANSQIYTAITNGKYYVVVTSANGCTAKSDVKDIVTSILELANDLRFNVYPNPTTGELNISGTFKTQGNFNIRIVDLMGKSVYENTETLNQGIFEKQINLLGNAAGIYFIIINCEGKQGMMKLILR